MSGPLGVIFLTHTVCVSCLICLEQVLLTYRSFTKIFICI